MKRLAIVNPFSGGKKTVSDMQRLLAQLENVSAKYEVTQYPGHAAELAKSASQFYEVVVVGGDGTLFEVLKGIDLQTQQLAILPEGTGNSLARDLGLRTFHDGIRAIQNEKHIRIDVNQLSVTSTDGSTSLCYSASTIGIGYPAEATRFGNRYLKSLRTFCYPIAATVKTAFQHRFSARFSSDDESGAWKILTGLLLNNTRYSGNFEAFPEASCQDGYFDRMEMNCGCVQQNLHNISVLSKKHLYCPAKLRRARSLRIELECPQWLMVDGELFPQVREISVKVLPAALGCYGSVRLKRDLPRNAQNTRKFSDLISGFKPDRL